MKTSMKILFTSTLLTGCGSYAIITPELYKKGAAYCESKGGLKELRGGDMVLTLRDIDFWFICNRGE